MGVLQHDVIDLVGIANDGKVHLTMYCGGVLGTDYSTDDLGEKAETYLEFCLSGQLLEKFPAAKGRAVLIRISCEFWPQNQYRATFQKMAAQLVEYDVGLMVDVSSMHGPGGRWDYTKQPEGV